MKIARILTPLALISVILFSVSAQEQANRMYAGLMGPVRTVEEKRLQLEKQQGRSVERLKQSTIYSFDEKGNLTSLKQYDASGKLDGKFEYKHDAKGRLLEMQFYIDDSIMFSRDVYTYDEKKTEVATYSGKGVFIEGDDLLIKKDTFTQDIRGNVHTQTKEIEHTGRGGSLFGGQASPSKQVSVETTTYDTNGKILSYSIHHDGVLYFKSEDKYGANGKLTESISYNYTSGSSEPRKSVSTYDAKGQLTASTSYDGPKGALSDKTLYTREFDSHGNWTKETRVVWSKLGNEPSHEYTEITRRVITYY